MPKDARLSQLNAQLKRLKDRKTQMEQAENDQFRAEALKLLKRHIESTEREIRKREYVLSSPSPKKKGRQ